ncbi:MAG: PilZ domain-containing protein [Candidatus Acidiferrum sp.]|jgi:hypothetical protein
MPTENAGTQAAPTQPVVEKRKYSRHQYIERVYILKKDGDREVGTIFEMSGGGMSAATTAKLKVGEEVSLSQIAGGTVNGTVRRNQGTMYGFEFTGITEELRAKILEMCKTLPLFRSSVNI